MTAQESPVNYNPASLSDSSVATRLVPVRTPTAAPAWVFPSPNGLPKLTMAPCNSLAPVPQVQYSLHAYPNLPTPLHELINRAFISYSVMFLQPILRDRIALQKLCIFSFISA